MKEENLLLEEKINKIVTRLERTRFKNKYSYIILQDRVEFSLNGKRVFVIEKNKVVDEMADTDIVDYVLGQYYLAEMLSKEYSKALREFVEKYCNVTLRTFPPKLRISRNDFYKVFLKYAREIKDIKGVVPKANIYKLLKINYNEKFIKCNGIFTLGKINFKPEIKEIIDFEEGPIKTYQMEYDIDENSLVDFVEKYFIVTDDINPSQRIPRSVFRKAYDAFCEKYSHMCKLSGKDFNCVLKSKFSETFIKSNGIFYMSRIKFKNLTK